MWNFWQKRNLLNCALLPLSLVFFIAVVLRKKLYEIGFIKQAIMKVPVIIVGNLTVGGSGKTSFVLKLANYFESKGHKVGIIASGYGSTWTQIHKHKAFEITSETKASELGDEPVLLKKMNPNLSVYVSRDRALAARTCIEQSDVDVVISDDGLQHYQLERDIEIILNDQNHNGFLLPAGPLREPLARAKYADFVIESDELVYTPQFWQDCFSTKTHEPCYFAHTNGAFQQKIYGMVGLAKNDKFISMVEAIGIKVNQWLCFADHHRYKRDDFKLLEPNSVVLTTLKDAVKFKKEWFVHNQSCFYLQSELSVSLERLESIHSQFQIHKLQKAKTNSIKIKSLAS